MAQPGGKGSRVFEDRQRGLVSRKITVIHIDLGERETQIFTSFHQILSVAMTNQAFDFSYCNKIPSAWFGVLLVF